MKKMTQKLLCVGMALTMLLALAACGKEASKPKDSNTPSPVPTPVQTSVAPAPTETVAGPADYSTYQYTDFDGEDWNSKTVQYQFLWIDGKSFGGMDPGNERGYLTSMFKVFIDLNDDGTLVGYMMQNSGNDTLNNGFDDANRVYYEYRGYWTQDGNNLTLNIMNHESTEYHSVVVPLSEDGTAMFDFDRYIGTQEGAGLYTLNCDGTIHYEAVQEIIDEANVLWDEEAAG